MNYVRCCHSLALLKLELTQAGHNIQATIVIFGGALIPDYHDAQQATLPAEQALSAQPYGLRLRQNVPAARQALKKCHCYEEARRLSGTIDPVAFPGGFGVLDRLF
jgi:hypothetical protein